MDKLQITAGYKQTEVGVIPEDWGITTIGDFAPLQRGFDLPNRLRVNGLYPVVYSNGIVNFHNQFQVKGPGVVTGRSGTIGKVHYVETDYWPHNTALWVKKFNNAYPKYVFYLYLKIGLDRFASGSGVPTLNRNDAHSFKIGVPQSLDEQTAIANALSDVDALIAALEKLIDKKAAIKTATMQQLLTGKKRLPPFDQLDAGYKQTELGEIPKDWEEISLTNLASIGSGGTPSTATAAYWNGDIDWCTPTDITSLRGHKYLSSTSRKITKLGVSKSAAELLPIGTIVMTSRATIGECAITKGIMTTNQGFKNFICQSGTNNEFLYYLLSSMKERFIGLCSGSTFLEISTTQVRSVHVAVPKLLEQTAIANVLFDMDTELDALQQRLAKTQHIKQGMMQELLTGKTRLITT